MDVFPLLQQWQLAATDTEKEARRQELSRYVNELLLHDFRALVQLLYRVDVPEKKLKAVLKENPQTDAGDLIAGLLLQRQQQKEAAKEHFRMPDKHSDEERW